MENAKKCTSCGTEAEKGMFVQSAWISGEPSFGKAFLTNLIRFNFWPRTRKVNYVYAWKCPACGKIDLYSDLKP